MNHQRPEVKDLKPLQLQCLIAIRNGIENGLIRSPHLLPPTLRQYILDMVLMHGTITTPNCVSTLSSVEFLDGLTCLDTQAGNVDDTKLLGLLTESMATIGNVIRELRLNVYACPTCNENQGKQETTLATVLQLIAQCPNLESLSLRSVTHMGKLDRCQHESICTLHALGAPQYLNDLASETGRLKKLKELRLIGSGGDQPLFGRDHCPTINFKNLSSLTLISCYVEARPWSELIAQLQNTLISLVLEQVRIMGEYGSIRLHSALPLAMPYLATLHVWNEYTYMIDIDFVNVLIACKNLKQVKLSIDAKSVIGQEPLSKLAIFLLEREAEIGVYCFVDLLSEPMLGSDSHFLLIKAFGDMVTSFKVHFCELNSRFAAAFDHVMTTCQNLEVLNIVMSTEFDCHIEKALLRLFDNEERALKLQQLSLWFGRRSSQFSQAVLTSIFKNCSNLKKLTANYCSLLSDSHLIEWASRGGRLSDLHLGRCENVSADGLVPVLVNSGDSLRCFNWHKESGQPLAGHFWNSLYSQCRFLEEIVGCHEGYTHLMKISCHNNMHQLYSQGYKH